MKRLVTLVLLEESGAGDEFVKKPKFYKIKLFQNASIIQTLFKYFSFVLINIFFSYKYSRYAINVVYKNIVF